MSINYSKVLNEMINLIQEKQIPIVMGNYDQRAGNNSDICGCACKTEEVKACW
ncbi:MAG: hypothetical protein MJB14_21820 [Spirochaetes bacterium]|nr:hypothetical protein [Spirochaetota bacterium]